MQPNPIRNRWPIAATMVLIGLAAYVDAEAPLLAQIPATKAILAGDVVRQLSDRDAASIVRTLPGGEQAWLLMGTPGQSWAQNVVVYMQPKTTTPEVRRGYAALVTREYSGPTAAWSIRDILDFDRWGFSGNYAQVAAEGRAFDQIQSEDDINRPFFVTGQLNDADLIGIAAFVRSRPVIPNTRGKPISSGPIISMVRQAEGTVDIWIRERAGTWQFLSLRQGHTWSIIRVAQGRP